MKIAGSQKIATLLSEARTQPRRRSYWLLHENHADQVQRLLIALQPGTYVRPHQHSEQWELLTVLKGQGELLLFTEGGELRDRIGMNPKNPIVEIPVGTWHSFLVMEPDTLALEIKPGPFRPNEFASWAPEEGADAVSTFLEWLATTPATQSA